MDQVTKIALKASIKEINIDVIMDIVNATRRPEIAIAKLLGIYEPPVIFATSNQHGNIASLISYDPFDDRLEYSVRKRENLPVYYSNETERQYLNTVTPEEVIKDIEDGVACKTRKEANEMFGVDKYISKWEDIGEYSTFYKNTCLSEWNDNGTTDPVVTDDDLFN